LIKNQDIALYEQNLDKNQKHFLDINHFTKSELEMLINLSIDLHKTRGKCRYKNAFSQKTLVMLFEKNSLRTRLSFDIGFKELGGGTITLNKNDIHLGEKETVADTSKVISLMGHMVMVRCYDHNKTLLDFAKNSSIPVINALTDYSHPCQIIAALSAFKKHFGVSYKNKIMLWVGAYNNVLLSYIHAAFVMGLRLNISCPDGFSIPDEIKSKFMNDSSSIKFFTNPKEAVKEASIVITDTWVSMGDGFKLEDIKNKFMPFQVNNELMSFAQSDVVFSHCLPAIRGQEVTSDVIDSSRSIVFSEAEFRLHSQKAIMLYIAGLL
jgi:ornithine carbamoyltransferase